MENNQINNSSKIISADNCLNEFDSLRKNSPKLNHKYTNFNETTLDKKTLALINHVKLPNQVDQFRNIKDLFNLKMSFNKNNNNDNQYEEEKFKINKSINYNYNNDNFRKDNIENNSNLDVKIFNNINAKVNYELNKRNILTPLKKRPLEIINKQVISIKEPSIICLSKSYNLAEGNQKEHHDKNQILKNNQQFILTKEIPSINISNIDYNDKTNFIENDLIKNSKKTNLLNDACGKSSKLIRINEANNNYKLEKIATNNKNNIKNNSKLLNIFYLSDVNNSGFHSSLNKSFNENKNFYYTPKNSIKLDEIISKNSDKLNLTKKNDETRLSNILLNHLDQSQMISLNIRDIKEKSDSKIKENSNTNIYDENENLNNSKLNSFLSDSKFFGENQKSNNLIRLNKNKLHLNSIGNSQLKVQRSFDFEKNKYKKKMNNYRNKLESINLNERNESKLNIFKDGSNLSCNKSFIFDKQLNEENNKSKNKLAKNNFENKKKKILEIHNKSSSNDVSNSVSLPFQDMSTTVLDKSRHEIKKSFYMIKKEPNSINDIKLIKEKIKEDKENDLYKDSFYQKKDNEFDNKNINNHNKTNSFLGDLNFEIDSNTKAMSFSTQKSFSIITHNNKNLLENSFDSSPNNNASLNVNNCSQLNNKLKKSNNSDCIKSKIKHLNSIEETHFNFVFISQASKKITKIEDLTYIEHENIFSTVVELQEIAID